MTFPKSSLANSLCNAQQDIVTVSFLTNIVLVHSPDVFIVLVTCEI